MANFFDQFDPQPAPKERPPEEISSGYTDPMGSVAYGPSYAPETPTKNFFDQFDAPQEFHGSAATMVESPFVGFNRGLANVAGAPVDVANWAMGKVGLPVSEAPFGGSESNDYRRNLRRN
jgi:hypothetical protein